MERKLANAHIIPSAFRNSLTETLGDNHGDFQSGGANSLTACQSLGQNFPSTEEPTPDLARNR